MPRSTVGRAVKGLMTRVRMSDRAGQAGLPHGDPALADALARWREEPSTAHLVREGASLLIFDAGAEAIVHAAGSALALRAGIADPEGAVLPSLPVAATRTEPFSHA